MDLGSIIGTYRKSRIVKNFPLTPSAIWDKRGYFPILANRSESGRSGKMRKIERVIKSVIMGLAKRQVRTAFIPFNISKCGSESRHRR